MILYICTDGLKNYTNYEFYRDKFTFENISGEFCLQIHYSQANLDILKEIKPTCIIHSGGCIPFEEYDILTHGKYKQLVTETNIPQLAICRGYQVLAHYYGGKIDYIRRLKEFENDPNYEYSHGHYSEVGSCWVNTIKNDILFTDLPDKINIYQNHKYEIKNLPHSFIHLAKSDECYLQAIKHKENPIYGVQFHPEVKLSNSTDGLKILNNFFRFLKGYEQK